LRRVEEIFGHCYLCRQVHFKYGTDNSSIIRQLLEKNVEWFWNQEQEKAFTTLKAAIVDPPVLKFFDQKEHVCLSIDASSKGMGAVLLQNDRPVAYALRESVNFMSAELLTD
jgi:hypothetical protein